MPNQPRVFISYARSDSRELTLRLRRDLSERGYDGWPDTAKLEGGASWSNAIKACTVVPDGPHQRGWGRVGAGAFSALGECVRRAIALSASSNDQWLSGL